MLISKAKLSAKARKLGLATTISVVWMAATPAAAEIGEPCLISGRSSHQLSKGIASGSATYSPCCSRQPSRPLGHLLGSDG
jgi:hypothetical protein